MITVVGSKPDNFILSCLDDLGFDHTEVEFVDTDNYVPVANKVLALGKPAGNKVLDCKDTLATMRVGPPKDNIVVTYSPKAFFSQPHAYPDFIGDLVKLNWKVREWTAPEYEVVNTTAQAKSMLAALTDKHEPTAIDIETNYDRDSFENVASMALLSIGISNGPDHVIVIGKEACANWHEWRNEMLTLLQTNPVIMHNGKFDLAGLRRFGKSELWFDTMLASYCLDERRGIHSLDYLARELLGAPDWKAEMKPYKNKISSAPDELLYKYNAYDVANTYRLYEIFKRDLRQENLKRLHDFLVRSSMTLLDVELAGIRIDTKRLSELADKYNAELEDKLTHLRALTNEDYNPNSVPQTKAVFEDKFGIGMESVDEEHLNDVIAQGNDYVREFSELLLAYRKVKKMQGTYVNGIQKRLEAGKIHTNFLLHGTTTGRLSSRNPNLQNIPRQGPAKSLFVPAPGRVLVQADYSQAELRALAYLSQDAYLLSAFNEGRDIHGEVATRIFGADWTKEQRAKAKQVVFGVSYGMGPGLLARMIDVSYAEAERYIASWFELIPQAHQWFVDLQKRVLDEHVVQSPFGHKRRYWYISDDNRASIFKESRAFLPQNIASNINLEAANRLRDLGLSERIRILVHDSIVLELDEGDIDTARTVRDTMTQTADEYMDRAVPSVVDVAVGYNWSEMEELSADDLRRWFDKMQITATIATQSTAPEYDAAKDLERLRP